MGLLDGIVDKKHILLFGIPGSGSTWLGKILTQTMDYSYVHEPDNELESFFGYYSKQGLPRFPILTKEDQNKKIFELFQQAFYQPFITNDSYSNKYLKSWAGLKTQGIDHQLLTKKINAKKRLQHWYIFGHMMPKQLGNRNNRVLKTDHSLLMGDFLLNNFPEVQPLFLIRHPAGIVNNLLANNDSDINRVFFEKYCKSDIDFSKQTKEFLGGLQVAIFFKTIEILLNKYPKAILIKYEDLVEDPFTFSYELYKSLEMRWNDNVELYLANSKRSGTGKETLRAIKNEATNWKKNLTGSQIEQIFYGYEHLQPINFYGDFSI